MPSAQSRNVVRADARFVAYEILVLLEQQRSNSAVLLQRFLGRLQNESDRHLVTDLVLGTLRWKKRLLHSISAVSKKPVERIDSQIQIILLLGAYQLLFSNIAQHAAINETVHLCRRVRKSSATTFVNGVLRSLQRVQLPEPEDPAIRWSHPEWLVERWQTRFGREVEQLLKINNEPPPLYIRMNELKTSAEVLAEDLAGEGVQVSSTSFPALFRVIVGQPQMTQSFQRGEFYIHDAGIERLGQITDPQAGTSILEIAAAPGGKTFQIAVRMNDQGQLIAIDFDRSRMARWQKNMNRLGVTCAHPVIADGRRLPFAFPFDQVVLDAPCSSLGVLRRHPEIRWWRKPEDLLKLQMLQWEMLNACVSFVRSGGEMIYSVCSFEPEETTDVCERFLHSRPDVRLVQNIFLFPHRDDTDGFFIAKFKK